MLDLVLERSEDVVDELVDLLVALRRIVSLDVDLPDAFAERAIDQVDATLPAIALRGNVGERLAKEVEPRVVECLGQELRVVADEVEGQIILPGRKGSRRDQLADRRDRAGLAD